MAQFYATIRGSRGEASRMGGKDSGITGHVRGWDVGARVQMVHRNGEDVCHVYLTGGSGGGSSERYLGTYTKEDLERIKD